MRISALFAGIAGLEVGLEKAGHQTLMFCEIDEFHEFCTTSEKYTNIDDSDILFWILYNIL